MDRDFLFLSFATITIPRNYPVEILCPVALRQANRNLRAQTFYGVTVKAAEVKMIVGVRLVAAPFTESKVLLSVVRNDAVGNTVGAEAVQDAVDGRPIYTVANGGQNFVVAQGGTRVFEGG